VKGTKYWTFNNVDIKVEGLPGSFRKDWLKCSSSKDKIDVSKPGVAGIIVPIVFTLLLIAIIGYVYCKRRKANYAEKTVRTFTTTEKPPRPPPICQPTYPNYSPPSLNQHYYPNQRPLFVSTAQQKIRWFKFSLQGQVWTMFRKFDSQCFSHTAVFLKQTWAKLEKSRTRVKQIIFCLCLYFSLLQKARLQALKFEFCDVKLGKKHR